MALTQEQIAAQMLAQLRILDPSASAEIGTPERKIIDTVAEAIAENQIDLNLTSGALDLTAKFGNDLDNFMALVGFGRQQGSFATGFVTFGRPTPSAYPIVVPRGTQVAGGARVTSTSDNITGTVVFQTNSPVTLQAGQTSVIAPIQALQSGERGNLAAGQITAFANLGAPPIGITTVTNQIPTTNGSDVESDAELKVRFRNTVFRNMAGTQDQYLALAVATKFSTQANVIGPISRYQEYLQVPDDDDSSLTELVCSISCSAISNNSTLTDVVITGRAPQPLYWLDTTPPRQISTIADSTWTLNAPYLGSTGSFTFHVYADSTGNGTPGQYTTTPSSNPFSKHTYSNLPCFVSNGQLGTATLFYTNDVDFVLNDPPQNLGDTYRESVEGDIPDPSTTPFNPNATFINVYTGADPDVQLVRPSDIVLLEYSYMSKESRNDFAHAVTNCVDVFVNGENPTTADAVIPAPSTRFVFNSTSGDPFYYKNYNRIGFPYTAPVRGHIYQGLFWQPVIDLPDTIIVGTTTYFRKTHYWAIEDISSIGGTIRSRNGIEWDPTAKGQAASDPADGPYTGPTILASSGQTLTITGYSYDRNIVDLQAALEGAKQVTTDILAHRARKRYFKLDLTIVYHPGTAGASTNADLQSTLSTYFSNQYFGTTVQLTDILALIRQRPGIQNVRWTNDVVDPNDEGAGTYARVTETDIDGNPVPTGAPHTFNVDFYLGDNELPALPVGQIAGDTVPGLILRPRAQNTFNIV